MRRSKGGRDDTKTTVGFYALMRRSKGRRVMGGTDNCKQLLFFILR